MTEKLFHNRRTGRFEAATTNGTRSPVFNAAEATPEKKTAVLRLFGPITQESAAAFVQEYQAASDADEVTVLIHSTGGSISAGLTIMEAMVNDKRPVTTVAVGEAASMAFCIFLCGKRREMTPGAALMCHRAHRGGDENDPTCQQYSAHIAEMIAAAADTDLPTVQHWLKQTTWISCGHALRLKLAHGMNFDYTERVSCDTSRCNQPLPITADQIATESAAPSSEINRLLAEADAIQDRIEDRRAAHAARARGAITISIPPMPAGLRGSCIGSDADRIELHRQLIQATESVAKAGGRDVRELLRIDRMKVLLGVK